MTSFSVALCTRNGVGTLPETISALHGLALPECTEFIFVDNASSDGTFQHFPAQIGGRRVARLREPRRGKSYALNTAIEHASGDYVAFLDDDACPVPGWLLAYADAARSHPATSVFCGQVRPAFAVEPPRWLEELARRGLCCGTTAEALNGGIAPVDPLEARGANLLIRRAALAGFRFDTGEYNYHGGAGGGEDTDIVTRLTSAGPPPLFVPGACVHHLIARDEMARRRLLARARSIGSIMQRRDVLIEGPDLAALAPGVRKKRRKLLRRKVKLLLKSPFLDSARRAELEFGLAFRQGRLDYLGQLVRTGGAFPDAGR